MRGVTHHRHSDGVALMPKRLLASHVPLLLAIFGVLLQLISPIAHLYHVQGDHAARRAAHDISWQIEGLQVDTHAFADAAAQPQKTQHDPATCWVCQLFAAIQHALPAQSLVQMATAIPLDCICCTASTPYFLPHFCPDSRAPPSLLS